MTFWREDEPLRDGRRLLLRRKQRPKPPFILIPVVIGRWDSQRKGWSIDHKRNAHLTDSQISGWKDLGDLL